MTKILNKTGQRAAIENLIKRWEPVYNQAVEDGSIVDDHMLEMVNFDLRGQLEVFLKHLENETRYILKAHFVFSRERY